MIEQAGDSVTITGKPMLAATYCAVLRGIRARRSDGLPFGDLQELALALFRAHMSHERHELAGPSNIQPGLNGQDPSDRLSVGEAAVLLGLSRRQVQRLAASPGGLGAVRVGRTWMLDRAPVLALAERRARHDRANGVSVELAAGRRTTG
jgi:excisionase family DNA binding protein